MPAATLAQHPPGPRPRVPFANLVGMLRDIIPFLVDVQKTHGDVASFKTGRRRLYLVSHPDHIRDVLVNRADNFTKSPLLRMAKITLGEGLLTSEGDFHRRQRRIMQPAFHAQRVASYADTFVRIASRTADNWQGGQIIDAREAMTQLTLEIVAKALFDADLAAEVHDIGRAMDTTVTMFDRSRNPFAPLLNLLPLPSNLRFYKARDRVFKTLDQMIESRKANPDAARNDFLSILLAARDTEGNGEGMSDEQVRFEAMTLFSAGHETTANAMVFTWLLLSQNPAAERKLHEELDRVLGDRPPTAADVPNLPYTRAVIAESMRLYPPAWIVARQAKGEHRIGDYTLPAGAVILMVQWIVHRDPRWWPNPETFNPDRWMEGEKDEPENGRNGESERAASPSPVRPVAGSPVRPRYAYFPFGGGPRACVGESFAWLEAILLLATLAQRFTLRRTDDSPVPLHPTITLRPRNPLPMRLEPRVR